MPSICRRSRSTNTWKTGSFAYQPKGVVAYGSVPRRRAISNRSSGNPPPARVRQRDVRPSANADEVAGSSKSRDLSFAFLGREVSLRGTVDDVGQQAGELGLREHGPIVCLRRLRGSDRV